MTAAAESLLRKTRLLKDGLNEIVRAYRRGERAVLSPEQLYLLGGYLLPDGRVDPRDGLYAADHLRQLGGYED